VASTANERNQGNPIKAGHMLTQEMINDMMRPPGGKDATIASLYEEIERLRAALEAVIGHGYLDNKSKMAGQDYVSKSAIAKVRAALSK
jgi:ribosomal protein L15